ncbi:MAG: L-serine dehydratase, iron-sulfur-dependent subunit beta [Epulopiscium sp. Nuni2H_MBin001]|nr:MAG: L-serine dehydratase, iron-sulfur-dependent subunit beta [Epulopiscium sp. Nuni2H_MBin001]
MKEISVFDVIGPNMIGPSSSHTAGALRIARVAKKLSGDDIKHVEFILYGSFAKTYKGHGTDRALVAGMLGMDTEDERIKEAFKYAAEENLEFSITTEDKELEYHPNIVEIVISHNNDNSTTSVMGASVGGGSIKIISINGIRIDFTGEYCTMFIRHKDIAGVTAYITKSLSEHGINIAFMRVYREEKGKIGYTIIEADHDIDSKVVNSILTNPDVMDIKLIDSV